MSLCVVNAGQDHIQALIGLFVMKRGEVPLMAP
jgi:hypothetical protein